MSDSRNGTTTSRVAPTAARRLLILGYYDGATDGVLEADTGDIYRFDLLDEVHNPDGCDHRSFVLRPLPADSLDRLTEIIGEHIPPAWPHWFPIWRFSSDAIRQDVDTRIDAILAQAGGTEWESRPDDLVTFSRLTVTPAARGVAI
jgi:hypothetical protein